jgi:hypothetical protein
MIAEKEVVLTFLLQLLSEHGLLGRLAFKGGTCLRKMFIGSQGRFSTDLDFTGLEEHDHEDVILDIMAAFEQPFTGFSSQSPTRATTKRWTAFPGASILPTFTSGMPAALRSGCRSAAERPQRCRPNAFDRSSRATFGTCRSRRPTSCVSRCPKILDEKIRACYQRNKARDIYDLGMFATRPLDQPLVRRLVVLKLWQARDSFDPARLMKKLKDGNDFRLGRSRTARAAHDGDRPAQNHRRLRARLCIPRRPH